MTQVTITNPAAEVKTCSQCTHFDNYKDQRGCGWCNLFNQKARTYHIQTNDCVLSSDIPISHELKDNLAFFRNINLDPFPTEVIELDREGYPMDFDEEPITTGDFNPNFVTSVNEPF